jgi:hypothetical protein
MLDPTKPEGFWVTCFGAGDELAERDRVRAALGLSRRRETSTAQAKAKHAGTDTDRTAVALSIWAEARDPRETLAATYVARRGLWLPDAAAGEAIRFHPSCPFAGGRVPAMVCLVRDIVTDAPVAIHRTALSADGRKIKVEGKDRLALGPIAASAIKLTGDPGVGLALGIGEGVETTLSLRLAREFGATTPAWSLISAGGIAGFPVLAGVEALWIAVDHDPAGVKAAETCATRWRNAGREVFLVTPKAQHTDLNDLAGAPRCLSPAAIRSSASCQTAPPSAARTTATMAAPTRCPLSTSPDGKARQFRSDVGQCQS